MYDINKDMIFKSMIASGLCSLTNIGNGFGL